MFFLETHFPFHAFFQLLRNQNKSVFLSRKDYTLQKDLFTELVYQEMID